LLMDLNISVFWWYFPLLWQCMVAFIHVLSSHLRIVTRDRTISQ
jgi:hypothetical protein